jgi:hypothetical protein
VPPFLLAHEHAFLVKCDEDDEDAADSDNESSSNSFLSLSWPAPMQCNLYRCFECPSYIIFYVAAAAAAAAADIDDGDDGGDYNDAYLRALRHSTQIFLASARPSSNRII